MNESGNPTAAPRVGAYALIGRDDRLLLVEHPEYDALPGTAVHTGEPIEQALRRALLEQLGGTIAALDFCAVVEHNMSKPGAPPASEVAFLFDVTLTNRRFRSDSPLKPHRWAGDRELASLHPQAIRNALLAGTLSSEVPWRPWTP